ncbi:MAG: hypothetical protein LBK23_00585 [Oscillospiraceae bacterium]|jgi:uncharacterized protein YlxW (UPF0749 family)|nr:hypothetical protein [Oscillospiraceae bacterium]
MRDEAENRAGSRRAVVKYTAILFAVVLFFIALSYFIGARNDSAAEALHAENASATRKLEALQEENVRLQNENEALSARLLELETELEKLRLDWAEDLRQTEDRYKADYNELLQKYNESVKQEGAGEND